MTRSGVARQINYEFTNNNIMKFAIISDIHDNLVNLEKFFNWCKQEGVNELICCGDIANGETLGLLAKNFKVI